MAIQPFPTNWLGGSPEDLIAQREQIGRAGDQREQADMANVLARMELAQKNRQFNASMAQRDAETSFDQQAKLNQSALQAQALQFEQENSLEGMMLRKEEERRKARIEAQRFKGMSDYQSDIAKGMNQKDAALKNLANLTAGNPEALVSFMNSQERTAMMEASNAAKIEAAAQPKPMSALDLARINKLSAETEKIISEAESGISKVALQGLRDEAKAIMLAYQFEPEVGLQKVKELYSNFSEGGGNPEDQESRADADWTSEVAPKPQPSGAPEVGEVRKGFRFNGKFAPSNPKAWDKI